MAISWDVEVYLCMIVCVPPQLLWSSGAVAGTALFSPRSPCLPPFPGSFSGHFVPYGYGILTMATAGQKEM